MSQKCVDNNFKRFVVHFFAYITGLIYLLYVESSTKNFIFFLFVIFINFFSLVNLVFTDPGKICKNFKNRNEIETTNFEDDVIVIKNYINNKWILNIKSPNKNNIYNYCEECNIFKIDGIGHCRECDYCFHDIDHHCYWLNLCIARNNLRYFYFYIFSNLFLLVYTVLFINLLRNTLSIFYYFFSFVLYTAIFLLSILSLFCTYYFYLALTGIKSREFIKNIKRKRPVDLNSFFIKFFSDEKIVLCSHSQL